MLGRIGRQIHIGPGSRIMDQTRNRVAQQPVAILVDVKWHDLIPLGVEGRNDRLRGEHRDFMFRRASAKQDAHPQPARHPAPTMRISDSSSIPNRWRTASRISATKASTSSAVAPPILTMKLACLGETWAPPIRRPLRPAASIKRPAESPGGFLNVLPRLRLSIGWVSRRCFCTCLMRSRIADGSAGWAEQVARVMMNPRAGPDLNAEARLGDFQSAAGRIWIDPDGAIE